MRRVLIAAIGTVIMATPIYAADVAAAVRKAPPAQQTNSWTGFHIGGGAGYGWYDAKMQQYSDNAPQGPLGKTKGNGWFATGTIGYDHQSSGQWVVGAFADYDLANIKGNHSFTDGPSAGPMKLQNAWFAGVRLGYLITPSTLVYVSGGYSQAEFAATQMLNAGIFVAQQRAFTAAGWFAGGGVETQLAGNWYGRIEYRYADYGAKKVTYTDTNGAVYPNFRSDIEPAPQTIRASLTYKFAQPTR